MNRKAIVRPNTKWVSDQTDSYCLSIRILIFFSFSLKLGPDGLCYRVLKIDHLSILKTQIESLLKKNRTATPEYDDDYDYSEYNSESTESMNSNGQYTVPLSLGFGTDQRPIHLQQQQLQREQQQQQSQSYTTFPNLNRVVKDDSHITPNLHVSSEKENQPFLVSTTGLDLGSEDDNAEDVFVESKLETSSSGSIASHMVPSTTKLATITVETEPSSTASFIDDASANTSPTSEFTNPDTTTVDGLPSQTTVVSTDPEEEVVTTTDQPLDTSKMVTNTNVKALESDYNAEPLESTTAMDEKITHTTDQDHTMAISTDSIASATTATQTTNGTTSEMAATEADGPTTIQPDDIDSTTASAPDEVTNAAQSDDNLNAQSSTNMPTNSVELEQRKLSNSSNQLPTLSQTREKLLRSENKGDDARHETTSSSLPSSSAATVASSSTTINVPFIDALVANTTDAANDSSELIDAIFIPSNFDTLTDEMDPAVGKPLNNTADDPSKFQVEKGATSAIVDAELAEAEIAPIIDTGKKSPRANIELIDNLDESAQMQSDNDENGETKDLGARLADELLFLGITKDQNAVTAAPPIALPLSSSLSLAPELPNGETPSLEETLNGAPSLGQRLNSDVTTEEPLDYESNEAKSDRRNADDGSATSENGAIPPIVGEKQTHEPATVQQQKNKKSPSVYSTFMNRLKYAPPIVDLSVDNSRHETKAGAAQYSNNPFDLDAADQNANERSSASQTTFEISDDEDHLIDGSPPPVSIDDHLPSIRSPDIDSSANGRSNTNQHQLQIGINCYLRNLGNKEKFTICDNA